MSIDGCPHSYYELARVVLPGLFDKLKSKAATPHPARLFVDFRRDRAGLLRELQLTGDFRGNYVFLDGTKPVYVGMSSKVLSRVSQHLNSESHYSASLVYLMAKRVDGRKMKRDEAMDDPKFAKTFLKEMRDSHLLG